MMLRRALLCTAFAAAAAQAAVPQLPIETFFGANYIHGSSLSPDGTKISFLAPKGDTYSLVVIDLATHKVVIPFHPENDSLDEAFWKGNDHLVFTGIIDGVEGGPLIGVTNVDGTRVFSLVKPAKNTEDYSEDGGGLIDRFKADPGHILVRGYTLSTDPDDTSSSGSGQEMIMKIDILHGERTKVCNAEDSDSFVSLEDFGIDHAGVVRTADRYKDFDEQFMYRDNNDQPWKPVHKNAADVALWETLGFTGDNKGVYVLDRESSDLGAMRLFDPATQTLGPVLFEPKDGEIDHLIFSPDTKRLLGVVYIDEKMHVHWFEQKYADIQRRMENTFPGYAVALGGISDDENRIVVRIGSDRDPGAYYVLDLAKGSLGLVTPAAPKIDGRIMAKQQPITFKARDGLTIHGYLTLPIDFTPGKPVPLIVHPHGGPFGIRDEWGFDPEVQFLANRGYGVIQVNYRGSGGYGTAFLRAGFHQWGRKMQDDLTDSVKWAVDQGYADPKRIAIFGASYGGYATLAGLTFTPDLYKCGINYVGVADINELVRVKNGVAGDGMNAYYKLRIGDDAKLMSDQSPVNFVERIRVPLLNAYGENDKRVEIYQWKELKAQLDKYHKDYDYMVAVGEGHGFRHVKDAIEFYSRVDAFLKKNL